MVLSLVEEVEVQEVQLMLQVIQHKVVMEAVVMVEELVLNQVMRE